VTEFGVAGVAATVVEVVVVTVAADQITEAFVMATPIVLSTSCRNLSECLRTCLLFLRVCSLSFCSFIELAAKVGIVTLCAKR